MEAPLDPQPSPSPPLAAKASEPEETPSPEPPGPPDPVEFSEPTEAEFKAWDRRDPDAEEHLYKWDRANLERMQGYFEDLQCFRHQTVTAGRAYLGGKSNEVEWMKFKRVEIQALNEWQIKLFADEPRIIENSKFIGYFLEAHELVMAGYPRAYDEHDDGEVAKRHAQWKVVEAKVRKYTESIGGEYVPLSAIDCARPKKE